MKARAWFSAGLRGTFRSNPDYGQFHGQRTHVGVLEERPPLRKRSRKPRLVAKALCGVEVHVPVHTSGPVTCKRCMKLRDARR